MDEQGNRTQNEGGGEVQDAARLDATPDPIDARSLVAKASDYAALALRDYEDDRRDFFAVHAGTAFEALVKALLASYHPTFLLPLDKKEKSWEWLLQLSGAKPRNGVQTISAEEALRRLKDLHRAEHARIASKATGIIEDRNEAIHLSPASTSVWDDVLTRFLVVCDMLRRCLEVNAAYLGCSLFDSGGWGFAVAGLPVLWAFDEFCSYGGSFNDSRVGA